MPAINPRRECTCHTSPIASARVEEEPVGWRSFGVFVLLAAALLVPAHVFLWSWGSIARILIVACDLAALGLFAMLVSMSRSQSRDGRVYARPDELSFTLGDPLSLHVGGTRGWSGANRVSVSLRCIDAVMEERETTIQDSRGTEPTRICYTVWADERGIDRKDLPAQGEAQFQFTLPPVGEIADPVGDHRERYWEVEVTRHGTGSVLRFRVLVYPPSSGRRAG